MTIQGPPYVFATMILFMYSVQLDDASPNFAADSTGRMSKLSMEVSFVTKYYLKGGQKSENVKVVTCVYATMQTSTNPCLFNL